MNKKRESDLTKAVELAAADFLASVQAGFANPYVVDRMRLRLDLSKRGVWYLDLMPGRKP